VGSGGLNSQALLHTTKVYHQYRGVTEAVSGRTLFQMTSLLEIIIIMKYLDDISIVKSVRNIPVSFRGSKS